MLPEPPFNQSPNFLKSKALIGLTIKKPYQMQ